MLKPPRIIAIEPAEFEVTCTQLLGWSFVLAAACLFAHSLTL